MDRLYRRALPIVEKVDLSGEDLFEKETAQPGPRRFERNAGRKIIASLKGNVLFNKVDILFQERYQDRHVPEEGLLHLRPI